MVVRHVVGLLSKASYSHLHLLLSSETLDLFHFSTSISSVS